MIREVFCESENEVVSDGKVLRLAIGSGSMVERDEEVEYAWLELCGLHD